MEIIGATNVASTASESAAARTPHRANIKEELDLKDTIALARQESRRLLQLQLRMRRGVFTRVFSKRGLQLCGNGLLAHLKAQVVDCTDWRHILRRG